MVDAIDEVDDTLAQRAPQAPRANALQAAWLREIGLPRPFLPPLLDRPAPGSSVADIPDVADAAHAANALDATVQPPGVVRVPASDAPGAGQERPPAHRAAPADQAQSAARVPRPLGPAARPAGATRPVAPAQAAQPGAPAPVDRQSGDVARADLSALQPQVTGCTACALSSSRQHAVFGTGPEQAEWMVVGEAPGEQEDVQALPFVGPSGQLLTEMLRAIGVNRETDVFLSNVIKCRPPGNRHPRPEEIEACKPFLLRQIQLIKPARLLVVGRLAAQVLLGSGANLNALRGHIHAFDDGQGRSVPLVVSFHPAYLLRSPQEKARAWQDLLLAAGAAPGPREG